MKDRSLEEFFDAGAGEEPASEEDEPARAHDDGDDGAGQTRTEVTSEEAAETAETAEKPSDVAEASEEATDVAEAAKESADRIDVTARWRPGDQPCEACGEPATRLWNAEERFVCSACVGW